MKLGLFGLGHLGKIHLRCLKETDFDLVGVYDPVLKETGVDGVRVFGSEEELIAATEACLIVAETDQHHKLASKVLSADRHCFVEKPLATTLDQTKDLNNIARQKPDLITQVGFVERYNPAFQFLQEEIKNPKFLEVHRLAQFNNRGNDVSVVYDLMIHDLDLILSMKTVPITDIRATGVSVLTDNLDICNARLEFEDGSVANVTASRISMKTMRKFRIFQSDAYLSMDLGKRESQIISFVDEGAVMDTDNCLYVEVGGKKRHFTVKSSGALDGNAILQEQRDFYRSIKSRTPSKSGFDCALKSAILADQIESISKKSMQ